MGSTGETRCPSLSASISVHLRLKDLRHLTLNPSLHSPTHTSSVLRHLLPIRCGEGHRVGEGSSFAFLAFFSAFIGFRRDKCGELSQSRLAPAACVKLPA